MRIAETSYKWWGLTAMLVGTFSVVLSLSFLFPATPVIMSDLAVSIETVVWLSLAYALGASVFEPMWGRLGDMYGRKRNALIGLGLFTIGALVCALSPNIGVMAVARFIQGLAQRPSSPLAWLSLARTFHRTSGGGPWARGAWSPARPRRSAQRSVGI